jgi:hypothetical protein
MAARLRASSFLEPASIPEKGFPMSTPLQILGTDFRATMHFNLHFNERPDFTTLDAYGRPQDSFQIFISFNPATANPANSQSADVIVRGDEIHIAHAIRIRDARPPVADPNAGGWGAIRGAVPFHVKTEPNGTARLTFDASFSLLGIVGQFGWVVQTTNSGSLVNQIQGVSP